MFLFPDYKTKGCPKYMNQFWADVCLAFIFELELNFLHVFWLSAVLYFDAFVI